MALMFSLEPDSTLRDIRKVVHSDFGVRITDADAAAIRSAFTAGRLEWTTSRLEIKGEPAPLVITWETITREKEG